MKPATRGCTDTVVTGSRRPENSSKSRIGFDTTSATLTVGGGGAAAAVLALECKQPARIAAPMRSGTAARLRMVKVFMTMLL